MHLRKILNFSLLQHLLELDIDLLLLAFLLKNFILAEIILETLCRVIGGQEQWKRLHRVKKCN